jgi:hypothetical protein
MNTTEPTMSPGKAAVLHLLIEALDRHGDEWTAFIKDRAEARALVEHRKSQLRLELAGTPVPQLQREPGRRQKVSLSHESLFELRARALRSLETARRALAESRACREVMFAHGAALTKIARINQDIAYTKKMKRYAVADVARYEALLAGEPDPGVLVLPL